MALRGIPALAVGRHDRHVGDAAEVERRCGETLLAQQEEVEDGDERRSLTARGEVSGAHVGEHRDAVASAIQAGCPIWRVPWAPSAST